MGGDRLLQGMAVETPRDASSHQFGRGRACIIGCTIPAYCVVWCAGSLKRGHPGPSWYDSYFVPYQRIWLTALPINTRSDMTSG